MTKTTGKEYFYMVSGLMVPKYMVSDTLPEDIEFFIDWVSNWAKHLGSLADHNMESFASKMESLYPQLCSIYAHWLEMEAARIMRLADMNEKELCLKLVVPFVSNLHMLSIDIQTAHSRGFETSYRRRNEIERYRGIINTMKTVATLLKSDDYEKAFDAALSDSDLQESEYALPLMAGIASKNESKTTPLATQVIDVYSKKIDDIIDAATKTISLKKLLIVDDMAEMLAALSFMLKDYYQIFSFTNGEAALNFLDKNHNPDAFILDIDMPNMDGFTLAKKIRERSSHTNTPILFLTGNSSRETIMKSVLYGAKAFILKPANKDLIISKLSSCLN